MRHIFVNLKRFDIPVCLGGVNRLAEGPEWAGLIIERMRAAAQAYPDALITLFFPEAHLLSARQALGDCVNPALGCQSVYREDVKPGGNFGAFTAQRTARSMAALGVRDTVIGHCEERRDKAGILEMAGAASFQTVDRLLNGQVKCAQEAGLRVLFCIGETAEEQPQWEETLSRQLTLGLRGADLSGLVIGYEPVWAIGPGKTPPDRAYIARAARFIKEQMPGVPVVYGGGLKQDNAAMLASIPEIDGGLIALTHFAGEIGFYPEECREIIRIYLGK